jgi:hypothetical protein
VIATPTHNALLTAIEVLSCSGELDGDDTNASDLRQVIAWLESQAAAKAESEALRLFAEKHDLPMATVRKAWREHRRNAK